MRIVASAVLVVALTVGARAQEQRGDAASIFLESATTFPVSTPQPTFHVDVDARFPRQTPLDALRAELAADRGVTVRKLANTGGSPPLVQIDLLPTINGTIQAISRFRRARAEENARRHVTEDLALFCEVHDCSHIEQAPIEGVILSDRSGAR